MKKLILSLPILLLTFGASAAKDTYPVPKDKLIVDATGVKGGRLILPLEGNLESLNPLLATSAANAKVLKSPVYESLSRLNLQTWNREPALAKSWTISDDGLTYIFNLREGVRWSDGEAFDSDDVIFTYTVICDKNLNVGMRALWEERDGNCPAFKALNKHQIEIKLKNVNVLFEGVVGSSYIIPEHKWGKVYKEGRFAQAMLANEDPADMVATGPFLIDKLVPDQRIVLKRNPYHYRFDKNGVRLPYYDKIVRVIVPDFQTTLVKFRNGELPMHLIRPEEYDLLKAEASKGNYTVYDLGPSYNSYYLVLNQNTKTKKDGTPIVEAKKLKLFSDKRFKQALSYAMDRDSIIKTVFHGRATPMYSFTSPANKKWYNDNIKKYPYDLAKAKALLAAIGLKDSNGDGLLEWPGTTENINFVLKTNAENKQRVQIANLFKTDFKKVGIDIRLNPVPFVSVSANLNQNFEFDAVILGWGSAVPPDPVMSKSVILSSGTKHNWNPKQDKPVTEWEKRIDDLMFVNQTSLDFAKRKKSYDEVQKIWSEELPEIQFLTVNESVAISNNIGNAKPVSIRPYFDWNIFELYDKSLKK